jgi:hypothetical protein
MKKVPALAQALDRLRYTHDRPRPPKRQPMSDSELALAIREFRRGTVAGTKWGLSTSTGQARLQEAQRSSGALIRPMANSDAEEFRKQADECRRLALDARSESERGAWLRLVDNWDELAEAAEARRRI